MKIKLPNIPIQAYDYHLPDEKIAFFPTKNRDESKLITFRDSEINHHNFKDFPSLISEDSLLIFNNTKVIPARIPLHKSTGGSIEIFLLKPAGNNLSTKSTMEQDAEVIWECMVGHKKRWKDGEILSSEIEIGSKKITLEFTWHQRVLNEVKIKWNEQESFHEILQAIGKIPLPPYLDREVQAEDSNRYQTLFSSELGAVAAPTASLHFSEKILETLEKQGVKKSFLTLHVGAGTFLPVKDEDVSKHPMHREQLVFTREIMRELKDHQGPIISIGTTAMRALESLYWSGVWILEGNEVPAAGLILPKEFAYMEFQNTYSNGEVIDAVLDYMADRHLEQWVAETEILIMPGYKFHFCDRLLTNFHQPKSTLLVLVSAFIGPDWKKLYESALANKYRFLSYGDACLLTRSEKTIDNI